ncbi:MAG: porin, partial [Sneathiella sp.]
TAGSANAADKIKLNVGGYLQTSFVAATYDNDDRLPTNIRHEGEIHFTGSTTLDNGLKFGVNIQLEARDSSDQVDETFMFVEGAFGRINMGSENSAAYLMHYTAPAPVIGYVLDDNNADASGLTGAVTSANSISDADKITYFTPRMSGFQFGASYTPDSDWETSASGGDTGAYSPNGLEGDGEEGYSIGANYVNTFNKVSIAASVGYEHVVEDGAGKDDDQQFTVGGQLGYAGFTVGAGYKYTENDGGVEDEDRQDVVVGVTYGQGPWTVGVQYAHIELDDASDGEQDAVVVGGKYILGPGITAFGGVQFFEAEGDLEKNGAGEVGDSATVFFVGTALSF